MKTRTDSNSYLVKKVKQWKHDQAIVSLTLDELLKGTKGKDVIVEQIVGGQTCMFGLLNGVAKFGTLGGVVYSELPVLDEIKKILIAHGLKQALIVGEMAGYDNGKIIPYNETESIIKNPEADKSKVHWFPYQILELEGEEFSATSYAAYKKTWPQLKKIFAGAKTIHPVETSETTQEGWDKFEKQKRAHRVACTFSAIEIESTSHHRAIYTFKNQEDYEKAYDLLNKGVEFNRPEYEYGRVDSLRQISIPEDKHDIVESLWAKHNIQNYDRSSSETSFKKG